jgi:type VI secretion system secreted protein VgrG
VSQPWAGKGWGSVAIPRIGQEVIVDFLEGDPDQPIITGRVYNGEQMPPYSLPAGGVVSGLKSNSTKGGGGFNEISMDDTKGKEKITIHGQYDLGSVIEHDQSWTVKNNDTQKVLVNRDITVDGTFTEKIKGVTKIEILEGTFSHDVKKGTATYHVTGAVKEDFDDKQDTTVKKDINVKSSEGAVIVNGKKEVRLQVGNHFISVADNGTITISGLKIMVTGGEKVQAGVGNQNATFDQQKVAVSGAAINSSAMGMHEINGAVVKIN